MLYFYLLLVCVVISESEFIMRTGLNMMFGMCMYTYW